MAVTFDASATNSAYSSSSVSATLTVGVANATVLAVVSGTTFTSASATCGGVAMSMVGYSTAGYNNVALFALSGVATGSNSVVVTLGTSQTASLVVASYGGVAALGTATVSNSTSTSASGTVAVQSTSDIAVGAFASAQGAAVAVTGTIRNQITNSTQTTAHGATAILADNTGGSSSDTVAITTKTSWAGVFVDLSVGAPAVSSDMGSGSDTVAAALKIAETGAGADSTAIALRGLTESGAGADVAQLGLPAADQGSGADVVATAPAVADTGSGADSATVSAGLAVSDSGSGADSALVSVPVPVADNGSGTDTAASTAAIATSDAGIGADSTAVAAKIAGTDVGAGADSAMDLAAIPSGDTGTATETVSTGIAIQDGGIGSETGTDVAAEPVADSGLGTDSWTVVATAPVSDSGTGIDAVALADFTHPLTESTAAYISKPNPAQLTAALYGRPIDAVNAAGYMWDTSPLTNPGEGQVLVQMLTNTYEYAGECGDYISTTATWVMNDVDTATVTLKGSDPMGPYAYRCDKTVVPIFITAGSMRLTGQVDTCSPDYSDGELKWTIQVKGDWDWYNRILVWPNFAAPIEVQFPKEAIYIGPAISCLKAMIGEQCIRLQTGLWELVNNITDPAAWFGSMLEKEGLLTPCAVVPTDPLFDTSKWVAFSGKMDTCATLIQQVCKDNGLVSTADVWMPGDAQPTSWFNLSQPTVVFDIKDRSGITGPTGTMIDGLIEDAVDLENSLLGGVLNPFLNAEGEYAPEGVNIAPALGVNFVKPWTYFDCDNPLRSGVKEFHAPAHAPLAWQIVGGGKSPDWVNNIINATIEFLLGSALTIVGLEGIPNTLLDGILDDVLLAYQLVENEKRRTEMGPYGKPEYFCSTGSTAYTLNEEFALEGAMWDTRGYKSAELIFDNGFPYYLGVDLFLGALASWKFQNSLYTDYVMQITLNDDRDNRMQITAQIGDNSSRQDPAEIMQRKLAGLQTDLQIAMLSSN